MPGLRATVEKIVPLTDRISEFRLRGVGNGPLPAFEPGAHIQIDLPGGARDYSLIRFAAPEDPVAGYRIAVQMEPDGAGGSKRMHALQPGDEVAILKVSNDFPLTIGAPAVLLAGGIGVTPMISMAAALDEAGQAFDFHYSARSSKVMAYRDALMDRFDNHMHLHFDDTPENALNLDTVIGSVGARRHLYICGPRGMIDAARACAEAAGIEPGRIHIELFDTAAPAAGDTAFEVEIASTGDVFTVAPGQSIIEALEAGGIDVMYDCQRGDCGICQTEVIDGTPDHRDVVLSAEERAGGKVMQICVSRAKSARLVLDI